VQSSHRAEASKKKSAKWAPKTLVGKHFVESGLWTEKEGRCAEKKIDIGEECPSRGGCIGGKAGFEAGVANSLRRERPGGGGPPARKFAASEPIPRGRGIREKLNPGKGVILLLWGGRKIVRKERPQKTDKVELSGAGKIS